MAHGRVKSNFIGFIIVDNAVLFIRIAFHYKSFWLEIVV